MRLLVKAITATFLRKKKHCIRNGTHFGVNKDDIRPENAYFGDVNF